VERIAMNKPARSALTTTSCLVAIAACLIQAARGDTPIARSEETREFDIFVKKKPVGRSTMRITDLDDGTTRVATEVNVRVDYFVYAYRYAFRGQEVWRGNQLLSTENRANDDGKEFLARARLEGGHFQVEANGRQTAAPRIDMTTNYWRRPDATQDQSLGVMNADRGTIHSIKVEHLPGEPLTIGRQQVMCSRCRLSGEVEADLWFDGQNRIVRQKSIEDGYPTELRLTRVSRPSPRTAQRNPRQSPFR
jgi:hypothetical protein